jgi:hypothetical protein
MLVTRTPRWGWRMESSIVIFSTDPEDPVYLAKDQVASDDDEFEDDDFDDDDDNVDSDGT